MGESIGNGRAAFGLATGAVALAAAFTAWAFFGVAYSTGESVSDANPEALVQGVLLVPVVLSLLVWGLLHHACAHGSARAKTAATVAASALCCLAVLTGFSIGLLLFPLAGTLLAASLLTPTAAGV